MLLEVHQRRLRRGVVWRFFRGSIVRGTKYRGYREAKPFVRYPLSFENKGYY